jgi:hypothetical protein
LASTLSNDALQPTVASRPRLNAGRWADEAGMRTSLLLVVVICLQLGPASNAQESAGSWLSIFKSETGFKFDGNLGGTKFAFEIPGQQIKTTAEPMVTIDGVFFQFVPVNQSAIPRQGGSILNAHKKWEQRHQQRLLPGAQFHDDDLCPTSELQHQHWVAGIPGKPTQAFITVEVGGFVLLAGTAYSNDDEYAAMAKKLNGFCTTFTVAEKLAVAK